MASKFHDRINTANNIFQMIALVGAAVWGYLIFEKTTAPTLDGSGFSIGLEIHWAPLKDPNTCVGTLFVEASNDGLHTQTITHVDVDGALLDIDKLNLRPKDPNLPIYLPADLYANGNLVVSSGESDFYSGPAQPISKTLSATYSPGDWENVTAHFLFRKAPNKLLVFHVHAYVQEMPGFSNFWHHFDEHGLYSFVTSTVCGT